MNIARSLSRVVPPRPPSELNGAQLFYPKKLYPSQRTQTLCLAILLTSAVLASNAFAAESSAVVPNNGSKLPVATTPADPADLDQADQAMMATKSESVEQQLNRNQALLASLTIFVLAVFVGFEIITKVPPSLHTPLMSGSNAISGITVVGAVLMAGTNNSGWAAFFGMVAVILAMINVVGGFVVTDRMLGMFKKKK